MTRTQRLKFLPIWPRARVKKIDLNLIQNYTQSSASEGFYSPKQDKTSSNMMLLSPTGMFSCRFYQLLAFVDLGNYVCHIIGRAWLLCQEMHHLLWKRLFLTIAPVLAQRRLCLQHLEAPIAFPTSPSSPPWDIFCKACFYILIYRIIHLNGGHLIVTLRYILQGLL